MNTTRISIPLLALMGALAVSSAAAAQGGPTTTTGSQPDESGLCSQLARGADLWLEEIPGGVALLATPKSGANKAAVRRQMGRLYNALSTNGELSLVENQPAPTPPPNSCPVFDAARLGVRVDTAEDPAGARILLTSADPDVINGVRSLVRDFISQRSE